MPRRNTKRKKTKHPQEQSEVNEQSRRAMLGQVATWAIGGAVLLGGGGVFALDFHAKLQERDLSVIGQGTPVILQIHDPQCSMCVSLQKQTRKALRAFDEEQVMYLIADVKTAEGAARQRNEGLPHVTLVLYDGGGNRIHVVQGVTPAKELIEVFRKYLKLTPV